MRRLSAAKQERLKRLTRGLVLPPLPAEPDRCACPQCNGPMVVQKSTPRQGRTLEHGSFDVRETVLVCAAGCRAPSGVMVTRRAACLSERLLPRSTVGYDVMVFVGMQRFAEHRQREEIKSALWDRYGLDVSTGEISRLAVLFTEYLQRLHEAHGPALRAALDGDGGWPMHIDATGEDGRGTLLAVMAGWRHWVLGAWKIPTERADAILPHLRDTVSRFGPPCAVMRDLGRAMKTAANELAEEIARESGGKRKVRLLACHLHFLADVGKGLLQPGHDRLRELFRRFAVRPELRAFARDLGRGLGGGIREARADFAAWQAESEECHRLPAGASGVAVVRGLAQWVLDYEHDGADQGFPFDQPYLDLYRRCVNARRAADAFLRNPPADRKVIRALDRLCVILEPVASQKAFADLDRLLSYRVALFEELRTALRLVPKPAGRREDPAGSSAGTTPAELDDIKSAVDKLVLSLRKRRPQRGPAQDARQAIDLVLRHLEDHGAYLWDRAVQLPQEAGGGVRLVDRTNNLLEAYFHGLKHGERRRSGRKGLAADFESRPAAAALVPNLKHPDYVEIVCGTLDNLSQAFAMLDVDERDRLPALGDKERGAPAIRASASMPREDRTLVRSDAMNRAIRSAARSRAPRTTPRQRNAAAAAFCQA